MKFSNIVAPSIQSDYLARCRQVLRRYIPDSESATIVPLAGTAGFSGAEIWRVEIAGKTFALRCWPAAAPEFERLSGLHRLLQHTARLGVKQIAVPCQTLTGESLVRMSDRWWQLEPWMPGAADFHARPTRSRLHAAMSALARWHVAARSFVPLLAHATWFASREAVPSPGLAERSVAIRDGLQTGLPQCRTALHTYDDPELKPLLERIGQLFLDLAPAAELRVRTTISLPVPIQPAFRDIWHDHLLFMDDELTGLIDPSACRMESVATDLARVLGSLVEDNQTEWAFAIEQYQRIRPLSLSESRLVAVFDETGVLLSGLTWLDWLLLKQRQFVNRQQVVSRTTQVLRRMESLRDHR